MIIMLTRLRTHLNYFIYVVEFIIFNLIFYHLPIVGDDIINTYSRHLHSISGIFHTDYKMFFTWTSRVFINPVMYMMTSIFNKWIFSSITALLIVIITYFLNHRFNQNNQLSLLMLIASILFVFPLTELSTAGYIATTVTYLWPVGFLALGLLIFDRFSNPIAYLLSSFCFLFAFNNEQLCIVTLIFSLYLLFRYRHFVLPHLTILIPLLINLLLLTASPGNRNRAQLETKRWYPNFNHLSVLDKLNLGLTTTYQHYLFGLSLIIVFFSIVLLMTNFTTHPVIASVPTIIIFLTTIISFTSPIHVITANPTYTKTIITIILIALVYFVSVCYLLHDWSSIILLTAGIISRILLGFSPTIYASSTRTFVICDLIIICLSIKTLFSFLTVHSQFLAPVFGFVLTLAFLNVFITISFINHSTLINLLNPPFSFWNNVPHR